RVGGEWQLNVDADDAATEVVRSRLLVGADGIASTVRSALDLEWRARRGRGSYAMADLEDARLPHLAVLSFERRGVVESFPMPGGRRRWVVRLEGGGAGDGEGNRGGDSAGR